MKNLKKVLALVIVFAMMVSSVAFAAIYPDVAADADYANAVSVLSDLGMIKGDDKGNFNPDATITRAEFATIVTRLLGVESAATGKANFADVAADHWATGYIAMAQQQGIISGYGDGNFGPENPVKYEEAVKMLVCALGYEQMAVSKGGWVAGYLTTAYQIGLLEDVSGTQGAGAPRSLVAQLSYNALDIPMMEQTGFGTDIKYEIMKKNDDHDKVTLLTKMGIYKLGGTVIANEKVSYKEEVSPAEKGYVEFTWNDNYDCPHKDFNKATGEKALLVGETAVAEAVGNVVNVYVTKVSNKYEVLAYEIDAVSSTMVINSKDLAEKVNWSNNYMEYYKADATKATKIKLDALDDLTIVENNAVIKAKSTYDLSDTSSALIELVDTDDNGKYDIVKLTKYYHAIVDEVEADKGRITDKNNNRIDFDIENDEAVVAIKDVNGNALELKDIAEGDVLAIVVVPKSTITGKHYYEKATKALKNADYDSLDVIVLKDAFVTASIDGTTDAGDYIIADKEYGYLDKEYNGYDATGLDTSAEGKFWLAIDGETVIGFEGEVAKSGAYAYIADAWFETDKKEKDGEVVLAVVTKDGYKEYPVASKVTFVNEESKELKLDVDMKYAEDKVKLSNTAFADFAKDTENNVGKILEAYFSAKAEKTAADATKRMVKIEINSNGKISTIVPLRTKEAGTFDESEPEFTWFDNGADEEWKADDLKLGKKMLADNAVVIEIDPLYPEKMKFTDLGYFVDESEYGAVLLDVDEDGYFAAAVVYASSAVYPEADSVAIVKNVVNAVNEDGDDIIKVTALKNGEEVNIVFNKESEFEAKEVYSVAEGGNDYASLAFGTVFMYAANAEGLVETYTIVGTVDWANGRTFKFDEEFAKASAFDYDNKDSFVYGYIVENNNSSRPNVYAEKYLVGNEEAKKSFEKELDEIAGFKNVYGLSGVKTANQYTLTGTGTKKANAKIVTGDYTAGNVSAAYAEDKEAGKYEVYYVVARLFEGKVVDIIAIDTEEGTMITYSSKDNNNDGNNNDDNNDDNNNDGNNNDDNNDDNNNDGNNNDGNNNDGNNNDGNNNDDTNKIGLDGFVEGKL